MARGKEQADRARQETVAGRSSLERSAAAALAEAEQRAASAAADAAAARAEAAAARQEAEGGFATFASQASAALPFAAACCRATCLALLPLHCYRLSLWVARQDERPGLACAGPCLRPLTCCSQLAAAEAAAAAAQAAAVAARADQQGALASLRLLAEDGCEVPGGARLLSGAADGALQAARQEAADSAARCAGLAAAHTLALEGAAGVLEQLRQAEAAFALAQAQTRDCIATLLSALDASRLRSAGAAAATPGDGAAAGELRGAGLAAAWRAVVDEAAADDEVTVQARRPFRQGGLASSCEITHTAGCHGA